MSTYYTEEDRLRANAITVDDDGYVRSMNPVSRSRLQPRPDDPPQISPETNRLFYRYPPNPATNTYTYTVEGFPDGYTHQKEKTT